MGSIADASSPGSVVYRSSKTGVNMVVKSLSIELAPRGVICLALHPGWVKTDMGGPNALITTQQSVSEMRGVIAGASMDDTGTFRNYDGDIIPW
jgi:NAD(P)-dependent dehydrogenase (short-subunit alcohol dehydrogenase family)